MFTDIQINEKDLENLSMSAIDLVILMRELDKKYDEVNIILQSVVGM